LEFSVKAKSELFLLMAVALSELPLMDGSCPPLLNPPLPVLEGVKLGKGPRRLLPPEVFC